MNNRLSRLSYNQLVLLQYLMANSAKVLTIKQISKDTPLKSKVLGGVLSSLSRRRFRGISLIEPMGKARDGGGLRWRLNEKTLNLLEAKKEVRRLLSTY